MTAIVWTDVTDHFCEDVQLSALAKIAQANILAHVNTILAVDEFDGEDGPTTKLARLYLAAHFGTSDAGANTGVAGPVTSASMGGLSQSFGGGYTIDPQMLALTRYGRSYLSMVRGSKARVPVLL